MTGDEVSAMTDAITECKPWSYTVTDYAGDQIDVVSDGPILIFRTDPAREVHVDDPRTAREVAALLVTWADTKEGQA